MNKFKGRDVVFSALVGSHNYNLNTPESDKDFKYFVCPTFDDLYNAEMVAHGEQSETVDYTVHDVRKLTELLWKSNLNFLETLYSVEFTVNSDFMFLVERRDEWATMNLPAFYKSCLGMHHMKMDTLHKPTATTVPLVERFGYDTKQACHALRILYVVERMMEYNDFGRALFFEDYEPMRTILLDVKAGVYTEVGFMDLVKNWFMKMGFTHSYEIEGYESYEMRKLDLDVLVKDAIRTRFIRENLPNG